MWRFLRRHNPAIIINLEICHLLFSEFYGRHDPSNVLSLGTVVDPGVIGINWPIMRYVF